MASRRTLGEAPRWEPGTCIRCGHKSKRLYCWRWGCADYDTKIILAWRRLLRPLYRLEMRLPIRWRLVRRGSVLMTRAEIVAAHPGRKVSTAITWMSMPVDGSLRMREWTCGGCGAEYIDSPSGYFMNGACSQECARTACRLGAEKYRAQLSAATGGSAPAPHTPEGGDGRA